MKLFDSHIHLQLLSHPLLSDFTPALVPAIAEAEWEPLLNNYTAVDNLWLALGVHPQHAHLWRIESLPTLRKLCAHHKVVAIGEVGLDSKITVADRSLQQQVLRAQVQLAVEINQPLILHCYKQYGALIDLLLAAGADDVGGIVHGFSGSPELALRLWQMGFAIGVGRVILNERARRLRATVELLPDEALVLETDAPWPANSNADGDNGGGSLARIARQVARLRGQTVTEIAAITADNVYRILRLP